MEVMPFKFEDNATVDHIKAAYKIIDEYRIKIKDLQRESNKQREMVDLFSIERAKKKQIKNCRKQLTNLKYFWDAISLVTYYYDYWKKLPW
jgi:t-SNARE complex subunit (syntaxin)